MIVPPLAVLLGQTIPPYMCQHLQWLVLF